MSVAAKAAVGAVLLQATGSLGYLYQNQAPVSVNLLVSPQTPVLGTPDQDLAAYPLARTAALNGVDQLKLSLGGPGEMYVSWQTGQAHVLNASLGVPTPPDTASYPAKVSYGLHPDPLGKYEATVSDCEKTYYIQDYSKNVTAANTYQNPRTYYVSQTIVHCLLKNLLPKTKYYYRAGAPGGYSVEYSFTTAPAKGSNFPIRYGVIADVGITQNSSSTVSLLAASNPDLATIIGDLTYSDRYTSLDVANIAQGVTIASVPNSQTYQPNWDAFGRQLQTLGNSASIPYQVLPGNHEIERDDNNNIFQSVNARYKTSFAQSNSPSPLYYSFDYGGVHTIMLNAYDGPVPNAPGTGFSNGGNYPQTSYTQQQLTWLAADLAAIDRSVTPWVVVQSHPPFYNTYVSHYKEVECAQQQIEDMIYNAGVDLVLHGHVHAYERTNRVRNFQLDPCGPVYVTLGDAGNVEYGTRQFVSQCNSQTPKPYPATCYAADQTTTRLISTTPPVGAKYCNTYENYGTVGYGPNTTVPGANQAFYIPSQQPPYSAYRNPSFGHALIEFKSATEATLSWYANQFGDAVATDIETIVRDPSCPNQKGGFNNAAPAAPSKLGQAAGVLNSVVDGTLINNLVNHTGAGK